MYNKTISNIVLGGLESEQGQMDNLTTLDR